MRFTLVIYGPPYSSEAAYTALEFARAIIASGHDIHRLFFYGNGIYNSTDLNVAPQGEIDLPQSWQTFIEENRLDAVVCIATALKRGVLDASEAKRYQKSSTGNLREHFELSGLGQLVEASIAADRVITFGN